MSKYVLRTYGQLAEVLDNLPLLVLETRRARGLSLREAGKEADVEHQAIGRLERGQDIRYSTAAQIIRWMAADV